MIFGTVNHLVRRSFAWNECGETYQAMHSTTGLADTKATMSSIKDHGISVISPKYAPKMTFNCSNSIFDLPAFPRSARPCYQQGMGLPVEIWLYIISFLEYDPYSLLACALTCRCFHGPSIFALRGLCTCWIMARDWGGPEEIVEDAQRCLVSAKLVQHLVVDGSGGGSSHAFTVVPLQFAKKFVNLASVRLHSISDARRIHPSVWYLYGRSFSRATYLDLKSIKFPSFIDFANLLVSFPFITSLKLEDISCDNCTLSPSVIRVPGRPMLQLQYLSVGGQEWFQHTFTRWFFSRGGLVEDTLRTDATFTSCPFVFRLLDNFRTHLRELIMCFPFPQEIAGGTQPVRMHSDRCLRESFPPKPQCAGF